MDQPQVPSLDNQAQQDIKSNPGQAFGQMSGGRAINISGGQVSFVDSQGNRPSQEALTQKREIPSLLPYLPNRTDQEFELGQAIPQLLGQSPRRPLLCLVHGDELQSHDKFLERLRKVSLPRLLRLDPKQTAIKEYHLQWPASLKKLDTLWARLTKNLADTVENDSFATVQTINQTFGKYPGPILVHLHLLTDDWQRLGPNLLPKILEFWQNWPNLGSEQTLVVCVFIKYQHRQSTKVGKWQWLRNPIAWIKRVLRYRRCQKLNLTIAQQLDELAASEFIAFQRLMGVVLPKLDNITRGHVEDWVRCEETKTFAGEAVLEQLVGAVRDMFDQNETMPMDSVATHLTELLKETVISGRDV